MKDSVLCLSYVFILFFSCLQFESLGTPANDGEITQTASAAVTLLGDHGANSTEEEKIGPDLIDGGTQTVIEPSVDVATDFLTDGKGDTLEQVFSEVASQNSGVANDILSNGPPVVLTLSDPATAELQQRADLPSVVVVDDHPPQDSLNVSLNRSDGGTEAVKNQTEEEIPSFSEWAQKRLEDEKKEQVNTSAQVNGKQAVKMRWKNYASLDCGAKVIAANPEAISPWAILSPSRDEYKLNKCSSRIWFVVELCEAIQAKKIDLANYELFSSMPKDFTVSVSDRFPSRDWSHVGHYTAKDERDVQSFDLNPQIFGKYIKVEVKSHYGAEHYCPISLFRVYGISVFEVLQKEDPAHENRIEDDDDDDESLDALTGGDGPKNLFVSATDAVISMVKKAAEVLGNKANVTQDGSELSGKNNSSTKYTPLIQSCTTPSHLVVCNNCSDILFGQIYELLSCRSIQINNLIGIPFIRKSLAHSLVCESYGFDFRNRSGNSTVNSCPECVSSFFPAKFLGAMCNTVAILENHVVLNISQQFSNVTQNVTDDKIVDILTSEPHVIVQRKTEEVATEPLSLEQTDTMITSGASDVSSMTSQINPTKALTSEINNTDVVQEKATTDHTIIAPTETVTPQVETLVVDQSTDQQILETSTEQSEGEPLENIEDLYADQNLNPTPQGQKESVFLRLSNRIKALERNMSLSGQYLEELSKRYKKQVEEMQKLLEKTVHTIHEESKKKDERNRQLEERLDQLTSMVDNLLADRNSWSAAYFWTVFLSFLVCVFVFNRRRTSEPPNETIPVHRRKSIDVVTHNPPPKKKRRPSDQALKICRSLSTNENERRIVKERRKKKKIKTLKRSNSINTLSEEKFTKSVEDWVEEQNIHIEDVPFALDDMEHSTLEGLPLANEVTKIDVPDFVQTAVTARLNRSASQNGPLKEKKSVSLDESNNRKLLQTLNGNGTSSSTEDTEKKERKGKFKKLFRKVF